jgi:vacuolar-type H+-ATPase subunit H
MGQMAAHRAGGTEEGTVGLMKSKGRVETAKDKVRPLAESAVGNARERVSPYAEKAVERGAAVAHAAVEKAGPVIDDALSKVGPATEHAAEKARERFNDDLMPKVTAALATLAAAAEPVIEESSRRGKATAAALKGEIDVPKKSHKLRKVVLFLGFGALAAAAVKKLLTPPEPAWQSTPTSGRDYSSAPAGTTSRPAADKPSGAAPKAESANGQTEDEKTEAKSETSSGASDAKSDDAPKSASNGAAKKTSTSQRRSTEKPTDS